MGESMVVSGCVKSGKEVSVKSLSPFGMLKNPGVNPEQFTDRVLLIRGLGGCKSFLRLIQKNGL